MEESQKRFRAVLYGSIPIFTKMLVNLAMMMYMSRSRYM